MSQAFQVQRTRPHGHVAAVLGTLRRLGLERLLATRNSLQRRLVVALIVARILEPRSKLATARGWDPQTLSSSLGELLQVEAATAMICTAPWTGCSFDNQRLKTSWRLSACRTVAS